MLISISQVAQSQWCSYVIPQALPISYAMWLVICPTFDCKRHLNAIGGSITSGGPVVLVSGISGRR